MQTTRMLHIVNCHAEGEVGDVIVGGVKPPPGRTLWEQRNWIAEDQTLRNFVLNEPRGGVFRHVNLLVPPTNPEADAAWIIMEPADTPPMSGSNSLCVTTVLLETGIIEMQEPLTTLTLEAPGGLVGVKAHCKNGRVEQVQIANVASFADKLDATLEVEGVGTLSVDTAYGGDSFVLVDARSLGFSLSVDEGRELVETGIRITAAANEQLGFTHPANDQWQHISFCQFTLPVETRSIEGGIELPVGKNAVVIRPGKLDRSPCGTGCSARMAVMQARGELKPGDQFVGESIIGSLFHCELLETGLLGDKPTIVPQIGGRAWITGTQQLMLDQRDPWPGGYRIGDTWPQLET